GRGRGRVDTSAQEHVTDQLYGSWERVTVVRVLSTGHAPPQGDPPARGAHHQQARGERHIVAVLLGGQRGERPRPCTWERSPARPPAPAGRTPERSGRGGPACRAGGSGIVQPPPRPTRARAHTGPCARLPAGSLWRSGTARRAPPCRVRGGYRWSARGRLRAPRPAPAPARMSGELVLARLAQGTRVGDMLVPPSSWSLCGGADQRQAGGRWAAARSSPSHRLGENPAACGGGLPSTTVNQTQPTGSQQSAVG